jgi:hypothetical protein
MRSRRLFVLVLGSLSFLWAAAAAHAATVTGSGTAARDARAVGDFQAIELRGDFDLVVRQSGRSAVEVQADDNLLALLETEVVDGRHGRTLRIGWRRGESVRTRAATVVTVDVAQLRALAATGSGNVRIDALTTPLFSLSLTGSGDARLAQLAADELSLSVAGSGDVFASGRAKRLQASIAGSGDIAAQELAAEEVKVRIAGSGDARVHAERELTVAIAGSGDVIYSGAAAVKASVAGSGSVRQR